MLRKLLVILVVLFLTHKTGEAKKEGMRIYVVSTTATNSKILPDTTFILSGIISDTISIAACRGEYEPASFVIKPFADINSLTVEATDLKKRKSTIPSQNIDIRVVKCWYQSGTGQENENKKLLTPELLLKDNSLIEVDYEKKENHLKLVFPEGETKYICMSKKEDICKQYVEKYGCRPIPTEVFPVKDTKTLLPVNIKARKNKQFWVTVNVPKDISPGIYTGKIRLKVQNSVIRSLDLKVKVLPFRLASPKTQYDLSKEFICSIYYRGILNQDWPKGSITSNYKSEEQLRSELKNLFAHGVTNPNCYQGSGEDLLGKYLKIRGETGMGKQPLYLVMGARSLPSEIERVIEFAKSYGIPEVYFIGRDEAKGDKLASQRSDWEATHEAGGKVFVAGYKGAFEKVGDLLDLSICAGTPLAEEAEKWHKVGHEIACYANPHGGREEPETYRRNYGLLLWKSNYDGAMDYAYQHGYGNIWNDYDSDPRFRGGWCSYTYPTVDGVIDTIQWEGYREGVDDVKYATTLRLEIEKAEKSRSRKKRGIASTAEDYLRNLDVKGNLDTVRSEIISYILKLTGKR